MPSNCRIRQLRTRLPERRRRLKAKIRGENHQRSVRHSRDVRQGARELGQSDRLRSRLRGIARVRIASAAGYRYLVWHRRADWRDRNRILADLAGRRARRRAFVLARASLQARDRAHLAPVAAPGSAAKRRSFLQAVGRSVLWTAAIGPSTRCGNLLNAFTAISDRKCRIRPGVVDGHLGVWPG